MPRVGRCGLEAVRVLRGRRRAPLGAAARDRAEEGDDDLLAAGDREVPAAEDHGDGGVALAVEHAADLVDAAPHHVVPVDVDDGVAGADGADVGAGSPGQQLLHHHRVAWARPQHDAHVRRALPRGQRRALRHRPLLQHTRRVLVGAGRRGHRGGGRRHARGRARRGAALVLGRAVGQGEAELGGQVGLGRVHRLVVFLRVPQLELGVDRPVGHVLDLDACHSNQLVLAAVPVEDRHIELGSVHCRFVDREKNVVLAEIGVLGAPHRRSTSHNRLL
mmetsp:Transcript_61041/g.143998  ORF Transcript_61041/g.143998 Transcript_61041/m.143998 type:complete len:276 (+) Transcript_61041:788-1615(+)